MRVLFLARMEAAEHSQWRHCLRAAAPEVDWLEPEQARGTPDAVDAAVVANPPAGSLQGFPRLRLIQSLWAGVDRLLADTTLPVNVPLARMVDPAMSQAMAETALWAVLALQRGFFGYQRQQQQRQWLQHPQRWADEVPVLVLGYGEMGRTAAQALARQGFPVTAWRAGEGPTGADGAVSVVRGELLPLLGRRAVLLNLLPLTERTRGLLDARLLAALPAGAGVVNLARGAHVVDADLLAALDSGHVGHAVLDVFHTEPLPETSPWWRHPRVTLLPHVAAATDPRTASAVVAANLRALAAGQLPANLVQRSRGY